MPRILLIEDDQQLRRALRLTLEQANHVVAEVNNGREGLRAAEAGPIDLVITDMVMPEMEGVETIRALRKLNAKLPIIAISGGGRGSSASYLTLAKTLGANIVLEKPLEPVALCSAVASLLASNGTTPAAAG